MTSWQIAFFTLQVVVGIIITAFVSRVSGLSRQVFDLDNKLNRETNQLREKTAHIEQKQGVSEAISDERFKSLNMLISEGFRNVEKNIDSINSKIDKLGVK
tara:strand:- start:3347 stop:3649 length:303 start_codon:yes stop_codon:yes gene_type:complete